MTTKQALLIIDVQRGLFDPTPRPGDADAVLERINALAHRAREANVPVIFVQHEGDDELVHGSPDWQLERSLAVHATDLSLRKTTPDSFLGTGLQSLLAEHAVRQLVVCGYASEFCVDTTTRRAAGLGYSVVLAADAHTTHDKPHAQAARIREHHNATLSAIRSFGPRIAALDAADIAFVG